MTHARLLVLFKRTAIVLCVLFAIAITAVILFVHDRMLAPFQPIGADFINLYAIAQMVLGGHLGQIYDPQAVMAFEHTIIDADLGLRLWAYPPTSLFFIWPFGLLPFEAALALWSVFGLAVLALAARRYGFSPSETLLLITSPAAIFCLILGQTGLIVTALVLLAFRARANNDLRAIAGTSFLTVKPQAGFLIPVLWLLRGQWRLALYTIGAIIVFTGASIALFGVDSWHNYLTETVPVITELERYGSGPFTLMMPSLFMAARLVGFDGGTAFWIHLAFAAVIAPWLLWRLIKQKDPARQDVLALVGMTLITPYLHFYDLTLLSAAILIVLRQPEGIGRAGRIRPLLLALAWFIPLFMMPLNAWGLPIAPLIVLGLFFVI